MAPIFDRIFDAERFRIEQLFFTETRKLKNLGEMRREENKHKSTNIQGSPKHVNNSRKPSREQQAQWREEDQSIRDSFMIQITEIVRNSFGYMCKELLTEHPMFESALAQIIDIEHDLKKRNLIHMPRSQEKIAEAEQAAKESRLKKAQSLIYNTSIDQEINNKSKAENASSAQAAATNVTKVTIDLKSYTQHSSKIKEIFECYNGLLAENENLRERMNLLKTQHDKEQNGYKIMQYAHADKDMRKLKVHRQRRVKELIGGSASASEAEDDDTIEASEANTNIVQVEFFDALEGLDPNLQQEMNFKLAKVRNNFQELLNTNLQTVERLQSQIQFMNELSPEAFSVANLTLKQIFKGCALKESDPVRVWNTLKLAYGHEDYFVSVIEAQYGRRFVANYNALYQEVNKVKEEADKQFQNVEEVFSEEVKHQREIVADLRSQLSLYQENFRRHLHKIQHQTQQAMEADFELRESKAHQELIKLEADLQNEIDERDKLFSKDRRFVEKLWTRIMFEKLRIINLVKKNSSSNQLQLCSEQVDKILGFLRGETKTIKQEKEAELEIRIQELNELNNDLQDQHRKTSLENFMLEEQIKMLDSKVYDIGAKVTTAQTRQQIAYEEKRKALNDMKDYKNMNLQLQSLVDSYEREVQRLNLELKKFNPGNKNQTNLMQAEIHRKKHVTNIIDRQLEAKNQMYKGVPTQKGTSTAISGIKGHVLYYTEEEYQKKYCKTYNNATVQTMPIQFQKPAPYKSHQVSSARESKKSMSVSAVTSLEKQPSHVSGTSNPSNRSKSKSSDTNSEILKRKSISNQFRSKQSNSNQNTRLSQENENSVSEERKGERKLSILNKKYVGRRQTIAVRSQKSVLSIGKRSVGVTCDILRATPRKSQSQGRQRLKVSVQKKKLSDNISDENDPNKDTGSLTNSKLNPLFSTRDERRQTEEDDKKHGIMPALAEFYSDSGERDESEHSSNIVNIETRQKRKKRNSQDNILKKSDKFTNLGRFSKITHKSNILDWRHLNERLKEVEQLEQRNQSQIKYEVDKAFEMTKYFDQTNFTSRDPRMSQVYKGLVQMCLAQLDRLTPQMILSKIEHEKKYLEKELQLDVPSIQQNANSVAKVLNYICLQNLNGQIVTIYQEAIKKQELQPKLHNKTLPDAIIMPPTNCDTTTATIQTQGASNSTINIIESNAAPYIDQQVKGQLINQHHQKMKTLEDMPQPQTLELINNYCSTDEDLIAANQHQLFQQKFDQAVIQGENRLKRLQSHENISSVRRMAQEHLLSNLKQTPSSLENHRKSYFLPPQQKQNQDLFVPVRIMSAKKNQYGSNVPRRQLESLMTIKSTNQKEVTPSSGPWIGLEDFNAENIVRQLITEKGNIKVNIEKTFKSANQSVADARVAAARQYNNNGFQNLLTAQKAKYGQMENMALQQSKELNRHNMKQFIINMPTGGSTNSQSNINNPFHDLSQESPKVLVDTRNLDSSIQENDEQKDETKWQTESGSECIINASVSALNQPQQNVDSHTYLPRFARQKIVENSEMPLLVFEVRPQTAEILNKKNLQTVDNLKQQQSNRLLDGVSRMKNYPSSKQLVMNQKGFMIKGNAKPAKNIEFLRPRDVKKEVNLDLKEDDSHGNSILDFVRSKTGDKSQPGSVSGQQTQLEEYNAYANQSLVQKKSKKHHSSSQKKSQKSSVFSRYQNQSSIMTQISAEKVLPHSNQSMVSQLQKSASQGSVFAPSSLPSKVFPKQFNIDSTGRIRIETSGDISQEVTLQKPTLMERLPKVVHLGAAGRNQRASKTAASTIGKKK